jgi:hypothetical protein
MVKIVNYVGRIADDGRTFFVLTIQNGVEMVKSKKTGDYYATARKASIPSTFDEETCKALIGTDMPGMIIKQKCEPYEYTIQKTGEVIELSHRYVYNPEEDTQDQSNLEKKKSNIESSFSPNGVLHTQ